MVLLHKRAIVFVIYRHKRRTRRILHLVPKNQSRTNETSPKNKWKLENTWLPCASECRQTNYAISYMYIYISIYVYSFRDFNFAEKFESILNLYASSCVGQWGHIRKRKDKLGVLGTRMLIIALVQCRGNG